MGYYGLLCDIKDWRRLLLLIDSSTNLGNSLFQRYGPLPAAYGGSTLSTAILVKYINNHQYIDKTPLPAA